MNQDVANEFLGCQPGKLNGERMNDQVIDAGILQQLHAFLDGIDEFDTAFLLQHHSWMRKKKVSTTDSRELAFAEFTSRSMILRCPA